MKQPEDISDEDWEWANEAARLLSGDVSSPISFDDLLDSFIKAIRAFPNNKTAP